MPIILTGTPSNITTPLVRTVTGAIGASGLIRLTTSINHLFGNGDTVLVVGVGGVPNASGQWTVSVVDATHIDLVGSMFAGSFTSGGTVTDISLTPQVQLPLDGEPASMQALLVGFQALLDRTQYLNRLVATYRLVGIDTSTVTVIAPDGGATSAVNAMTLSSNPVAGDVIEATISGFVAPFQSGTPTYPVAVEIQTKLSAIENGGAPIALTGGVTSGGLMASGAYTDAASWPITVVATRTVVTPGTWTLQVEQSNSYSGGYTSTLQANVLVKTWRPT